MENILKKDMPEYYKKLKPYIDYLESLGFKSKEFNKKYFTKGDPENYEYFNTWKYDSQRGDGNWSDQDYVCDLILSTGELKLEIYQYEIIKQEKKLIDLKPRKKKDDEEPHLKPFPYIMDVPNYDGDYKSVIVDNLDDFKIQIGNYLKKLKEFKEMKKKYELEADFT